MPNISIILRMISFLTPAYLVNYEDMCLIAGMVFLPWGLCQPTFVIESLFAVLMGDDSSLLVDLLQEG